jgi:hypothetical protein
VKTRVTSSDERQRFLEVTRAIADRSEARVRGRVPIRVDLPREETKHYDGHVLKELGGLLIEVRGSDADSRDRESLEMVLSAVLIKVSRQRADTSERETERRILKGLTTELLERKAKELAERWTAFQELLPPSTKPAAIRALDARQLDEAAARGRAALVLTSPPYAGTYDYATHHARREAFLGLDGQRLRRGEIGARRRVSIERWDQEVRDVLTAVARTLEPGGLAVLLTGDGQIAGRRIDAADHLARVCEGLPLEPLAGATALRPDFTGGEPRREHLLAIRRST